MRVFKQAGSTRFLMTVGIYAVMAGFLILQTASAATITVTHFDDGKDDADATCTLREAIRTANGGAAIDACELVGPEPGITIELAAGTYNVDLSGDVPAEDNGVSGDLDIFVDVTIRGVAAEHTIIDGGSATSQERVFHIFSGLGVLISAQLFDVTVKGGNAVGGRGGNIRVAGANMGLLDVIVTGGRAAGGGGIYVTGALANLSLRRTQIVGNEAVGDSGLGGGMFVSAQNVTITDSVVNQNRAGSAGGLYAADSQFLSIRNSELSENEAIASVGVRAGCGGGMYIAESLTNVTVSRTLISGNSGRFGGGICWAAKRQEIQFSAIVNNVASEAGGGIWALQDVFIRHSTISGNTAAEGGGIYTLTAETLLDAVTVAANTGGGMFNEIAATAELSLFANNAGGNCTGVPTTGFLFNLDDGNTCAFPSDDPATPNFVNTDPLLGPLADNGGGLPTHALMPGSPAIDAYNSLDRPNCQGSPDQRTYPRGYPTKVGDGSDGDFQCDIGAFEFNAPFVVDSAEDTIDANTEDGRCEDAAGNCTLRAAVMQASVIPFFNDIELGPETYSLTIPDEGEDDTETSGDLDATGGMRLRGMGQDSTVINVSAGAGSMRILHAKLILQDNGVRLLPMQLQDLTLSGGTAEEGGGVFATQPLELTRVTFRENRATEANGGAVLCRGFCSLTATDSIFENNEAANSGGAIFHDGAGPLKLYGSTLTENDAKFGGGIATTAGLHAQNATLSGNKATGSAGAIFADRVVLDATTITNNEAGQNTGALLAPERSAIVNTIIAGNLVGAVSNSCTLTSNVGVSLGGNLSDTDADDCRFDAASDVVLADPKLGPLTDNGGLTPTHALLSGSAAIDAGDADRCAPVDQRGFLRPADGDGDGTAVCDIGAVEAQSADVGISITATPNPATVGGTVTSTVVIANAGPETAEAVVMVVTLPTSFSSVSISVIGADSDCNTAANQETCELGNLATGAEVTVEITATADAPGSLAISAEAMSLTTDGAAGNDIAEATVTVNAQGTGGGNPGGGAGGGTGGSGGGGGGAIHLFVLVLLPVAVLCRYGKAARLRGQRIGPLTVALLAALGPAAHADPVTDLISFSANTTASAGEVNDNFSTLANAVNDNDARIASMEAADGATRIEALELEIAELKVALSNLVEINQYVTMETVNGQPAIRLTGVNLQIVNGMDQTATANGTGNLIVGYDEERSSRATIEECSLGTNPVDQSQVTSADECAMAGGTMALNHKSGSHYVVVGQQANYTRWGGLVVGDRNTSNYDFASVSGGHRGLASGESSSISGGSKNIARGKYSSISGGEAGRAGGAFSSISGGLLNIASGRSASVGAGVANLASGYVSSVSGGRGNWAIGENSTVSGGKDRRAPGDFNWVAGSFNQTN